MSEDEVIEVLEENIDLCFKKAQKAMLDCSSEDKLNKLNEDV